MILNIKTLTNYEVKMINVDELISEIESLPIDIKTELIDKLLNSINPSQKDINKLWAKEAEKRVAEIKSGKVKTIPGEKVFSEIQDKFAK
jgi:putative addiction module component (TIGR02574 family)